MMRTNKRQGDGYVAIAAISVFNTRHDARTYTHMRAIHMYNVCIYIYHGIERSIFLSHILHTYLMKRQCLIYVYICM